MPSKKRNQMPDDPPIPYITKEFLDRFLAGPMTAGDVGALMPKLKKAVIKRALGAEMRQRRGCAPGEVKQEDTTNHHNTVPSDDGPRGIEIPRDRKAAFKPQLIGKHERRFTGCDDRRHVKERRAAPWKSLRLPCAQKT
jgi:putative transposase